MTFASCLFADLAVLLVSGFAVSASKLREVNCYQRYTDTNTLFCLFLSHPSYSVLHVFPPVSLNVSPNRQQFFSGESVRLCCEKDGNSAGWTLKRISLIRTETCEADEGFGRLNGSTCIISDLSLSSGQGVYWCEHHSGQRSTTITVTVSGRRATVCWVSMSCVNSGRSFTESWRLIAVFLNRKA